MEQRGRSLARLLSAVLLGLAMIVAIGLIGMLFGGALALIQPTYFEKLAEAGLVVRGLSRGDMTIGLMLGLVTVASTLWLTLLLRRVLRRVAKGEPFHPGNPRDLRMIALSLALVSGLSLLGDLLIRTRNDDGFDLDLTAWMSVLIVLVLSEVFREGARLRSDAELTV